MCSSGLRNAARAAAQNRARSAAHPARPPARPAGTIGITKEGIKFSVKGDLGTGNILRKAGKHGGGKKKGDDDEKEVKIVMDEPVELTFALRYLGFFCKAAPLSPNVILHMSKDVPLMVEFVIEDKGTLKCASHAQGGGGGPPSRRRERASSRPATPLA